MSATEWTRDKPTVAGWYLVDLSLNGKFRPRVVFVNSSLQLCDNNFHGVRWLGPIPASERQKGV